MERPDSSKMLFSLSKITVGMSSSPFILNAAIIFVVFSVYREGTTAKMIPQNKVAFLLASANLDYFLIRQYGTTTFF